jgi:hypothetical protein
MAFGAGTDTIPDPSREKMAAKAPIRAVAVCRAGEIVVSTDLISTVGVNVVRLIEQVIEDR